MGATLPRSFGRPSQALEHSGLTGETDLDKLTDEELTAYIEAHLQEFGYRNVEG
jgi:hypothetical protein